MIASAFLATSKPSELSLLSNAIGGTSFLPDCQIGGELVDGSVLGEHHGPRHCIDQPNSYFSDLDTHPHPPVDLVGDQRVLPLLSAT